MAKRFKKSNNYHNRSYFYVTFYEEYPIYEAAEGGYYYTGREPAMCFAKCISYKKAKRLYEKYCKIYNNYSKYIGESQYCLIETKFGKNRLGKQIYN